ncbi:helix-turn-helix transcriptional regulator [Sphingomonas sp. CD22]|uniref:helix-turn-helix transcriptional regulator n=1 Tax=Sphingomonas sp. CD22 TaxID=3100214 RepID=UPI002ADF42FB|nr:helix-turn-helix transcriptional regulator [Sphingomonas sp. CD22]MEA1083198.1 helix-turn-helix transcriptional regulator [Sphingomonas sp. CD22]
MVMQGEEMKALRTRAGLSQAELGEAIGMARETIGAMERGTHGIELRTELAVRYVAEPRIKVRQEAATEATGQVVAAVFGQGPAATMSIAEIEKALRPLLDKRYQRKAD